MRVLTPKHRVINGKILFFALAFFLLYALTVNKYNSLSLGSGNATVSPIVLKSDLEVRQTTILLHQLRAQNEEKEKIIARGINESTKPSNKQ